MTSVLIEKNVSGKMRDGTILRADVYRPAEDGSYPVLLQRTPYNKEFWPFTSPTLDPRRAASSGYIVAIQDVRGRWASDGDEFTPYLPEHDDGKDSVDWAATIPGSNGQVGCYGISYMGGAAWLAAYNGQESVRATAPAIAPCSWSEHFWRGGAFVLGLATNWGLGIGLTVLPRKKAGSPEFVPAFMKLIEDIDSFDEVVKSVPLRRLSAWRPDDPDFLPFLFEWMSRPGYHPGNKEMLKEDLHSNVKAPALIVSGWHDITIGHDIDHYLRMKSSAATAEAREKTKLVIGPWSHANLASFTNVVGEIDYGIRASGALIDLKEDLTSLHLRWFDRWLKGEQNGIDEEPRVKIFVQGLNRWRDEEDWPLARAVPTPWYLHSDGVLSPRKPEGTGEPSSYIYDPADPCPTRGGTILMPLTYTRGPVDQRPILGRGDVLLFQSEALQEAIEVTGPVTARLFVATDRTDTDFVVKLCDVHPDGRVINVCDGILRVSYREHGPERKLLEPNTVYEVEIDLWATSNLFVAGHRIAVVVSSSDFPRYDRNPNTGELGVAAETFEVARQTVFHDSQRPSHLLIPVIPA